jgi:hypothetical protein
MTPTLTRLVMAARAPHRRLSHHLDTHPGGRMPINLPVIPQVIPHAQYLEHLQGAFDSSEDTVRLFASLSLARLHPDVTSWKAAAEALNMPGPMGVRLRPRLLGHHARHRGRVEEPDLAGRRGDANGATTEPPKPRSSTGST